MMNRKLNVFVYGIVIFICMSGLVLGCPTPKVDSLSVNHGINTETVELTITGTGFHKSTYVKLTKSGEADILAENVKVISSSQVTCSLNLSGKTPGQWDVVVGNIGTISKKDKPTTIINGFTIEYPGLNITAIEPAKAVNNASVAAIIHGTHFRSGAKVVLSNGSVEIGASNIEVISDTRITCTFNLAGATTGIYNVKVINDDGKTGVLTGGFTVIPDKEALTIASIVPNEGFNNGKIFVTITGTGFDPEATVKLTGNGPEELLGLNIKVESATQLSCYFDINTKPVGRYNVILTNPDGQSATLDGGFTVNQFAAADPNQLLKPIFFDFDKAELRADQLETINADIEVLKNNPKLYILLGGHADERGTREYNLELSRRRAETVKQYLARHGIATERIVIYAYGKDYPAKEGHDESAWSYNRRVDIIVFETRPDKMSGIKKQ